jgi:salicylate hydroxylase
MLRADPELSQLLETATIWWGPHRNIVGVPIQNGQLFSLECTHPGDTGTAGDWNKKGDVELMKATYSDFEPLVLKLLGMVKAEDLLVWKLNQLPELDSWVFGGGRVCLIGDGMLLRLIRGRSLITESCACYDAIFWPGIPSFIYPERQKLLTTAKGHAMAIEDSVALSLCLARCTSTSSIPRALHAFEAIRKPRTTVLGKYSEHNARIWQLPDGPEQRERDERSRKTPFFIAQDWDGRHVDEVPGIPPDPLFFPYMLAHDVVAFVSFAR